MLEMLIPIIMTIAGLGILVAGGSVLISGSVSISKRIGLSGFIIGMTIVAYGTSAPEFASSMAAIEEHPGIVLGNISGSNVANIGLVSAVALISGSGFVAVWKKHLMEFIIVAGCSLLLLLLLIDGDLSLIDGIILLVSFIASAVLITKQARSDIKNPDTQEKIQDQKIWKSAFYIIAGIGALWIGSVLTIDGASTIGTYAGLSDHVVGITIIAVGTSLPELVTTVIAIRKKAHGLFFGNIIGSVIANALLIGGMSVVVANGLASNSIIFTDMAIALVFIVAFLLANMYNKYPKFVGITLLVSYIAWIVSSLGIW